MTLRATLSRVEGLQLRMDAGLQWITSSAANGTTKPAELTSGWARAAPSLHGFRGDEAAPVPSRLHYRARITQSVHSRLSYTAAARLPVAYEPSTR